MKPSLFSAATALILAVSTWAADNPPTLALGTKAPDFDLPGVDGRHWKLSDFAESKLLVVVFTCNHCPTAQYYQERLRQLLVNYRDQGVALVAISPNDPHSVRLDELGWTDLSDSFAEMKLRAQHAAFNFPYLYDGENETVSRAYGPVATPHAFLFDSQRKLRYVGRIDDSERPQHVKVHFLQDAIEALLRNQEPPVTQTKALGCSVKWAGKSEDVEAFMAKLAREPVSVNPIDAAGLTRLRAGNPEKFRLINFWATWCPPCLVEFHEFVTMNRMYRHRDIEIITVAANRPDEHGEVLAFLTKQQASTTNFIFGSTDRDALINAFNPDWQGAVPYTVLLSPEGKIVKSELDNIDPLEWRRAIVQALNERKPW